MFKKYKIKKRKKTIPLYYIFVLVIILTLSMSYAYAYLSDSVKISGTANILPEGSGDSEEEYGNSTYSWSMQGNWESTGSWTYNLVINITNMDYDFAGDTQIEISFDLPEGLVLAEGATCNIWQAESITQTGTRVTILFKLSNSYLSMGGSLTIYPHFVYADEQPDLTLTNLSINGKLAQLET